ncbi:MAG: DoxX family membrane protein [Chloroflexi bacterium]|nr:DoxX family membrane protein [Chloroflexota bacterium]
MSVYDVYKNRPMVRDIISIVACVVLGAILIFSGTGKLGGLGQMPGQTEFLDRFIPDFLLTPDFAYFIGTYFIPWILPIAEFILGMLLILGIMPRLMAILFLPLVLGFMANNSYMIMTGLKEYPDCGCFGIWERILGPVSPLQSMYMDIGMFILAVIIIVVHPAPFFSHQFWVDKIFARNKI